MSDRRIAKKERQAAQIEPENFKCGNCKKVQPYDEENPYVCVDCGYGKLKEVQ